MLEFKELYLDYYKKVFLNTFYGLQVTNAICKLNDKENNMRDKVIVLHDDGKPFIIVKEKIEAIEDVEGVRDCMTSKCCIHLSGGAMLFANETYSEVVKRYFS